MRTTLVCLLLGTILGAGCRCTDPSMLSDECGVTGPTHLQFWELRRDFERYGQCDHWHVAGDPWDEW